MTATRKINKIANTAGLEPCAWCSGRSSTLPLGICKNHAMTPHLIACTKGLRELLGTMPAASLNNPTVRAYNEYLAELDAILAETD